jgi:raffinose/stachyose/melibiose transport system permease protein
MAVDEGRTGAAGGRTGTAGRAPAVYGRGITPYLYILPAFLVFVPFVIFPFLRAIQLSFFEWDGLNPREWVGFKNYTDAFVDPLVRTSFRNAFELVLFIGVLPVCIGLVLSSMSASVRVPGDTVFRTMIFMPQVIAGVVVGVTWRWIVAPDGPLNEALRAVGLGSFAKTWLGDSTWALPTIGVIGAWATTGLCLALFNAAIQQIPESLYEAAAVDGAGRIRSFFAVTLPGLRGPIAVALTLTTIGALRTFDLIFITTKGGPGTSTYVPGMLIYNRAFGTNVNVGSSAAIAILLSIVVFAVIAVIRRIGERRP